MVEPHTPGQSEQEATFPLEHLRKTLEELLAETSEGLKRTLAEKKPHLSEITLLTEYLVQLPYRRDFNPLVQAFKRDVTQMLPERKAPPEPKKPAPPKTAV